MVEYQFPRYIKSLRHYLLNKKRPVASIVLRYRNRKSHLILQFLKSLFRYTSLSAAHCYTVEDKAFGIAGSRNQLNELLGLGFACVYYFGRKPQTSRSTRVICVKLNTFFYLFHFLSLVLILRKTRFILYADIIALMYCYECVFRVSNCKTMDVYVSNLNSPLISNVIYKYCLHEKVTHIPHAVLGASCLPDLRLCKTYYCWGVYEKAKFPDKSKVKLSRVGRPLQFIGSQSGPVNVVLPKDLSKIQFSPFANKHLLLKFHPGSSVIDVFNFKINLWRKNIKFNVICNIDTRFRVYSVSTTAILSILKQGKCVYMLQSEGLDDHYDMSRHLLTTEAENLTNYKKQLYSLSVYDAALWVVVED